MPHERDRVLKEYAVAAFTFKNDITLLPDIENIEIFIALLFRCDGRNIVASEPDILRLILTLLFCRLMSCTDTGGITVSVACADQTSPCEFVTSTL